MEDPTLAGGALPGPVLERILMECPPSIYDEQEQFSLVSALNGKLKAAVLKVPAQVRLMDEAQLKKHFGKRFDPTRCDYALRTSFWCEYGRAMANGLPHMTTASIYAGVCSETHFYGSFLEDEARVAWLVLPQQTYKKEMEAILHRVTERLWEIVEMDIRDPKTRRTCPRRAEVLLKAAAQITDRARGMAVQRVEKKTQNIPAGGVLDNRALSKPSVEQLRQKLVQLEGGSGVRSGVDVYAGDGEALSAPLEDEERTVIDVTPVRSPDGDA